MQPHLDPRPSSRDQPPSRSVSQASSYHTVADHFSDALSSPDSDPITPTGSTPTTSLDSARSVVRTTRPGKALVIEQPTQVNFVPTNEIQTAVSVTADRIVIDTILPPTASLRSGNYVPRSHSQQPQQEVEGGLETAQLLKKHEEELTAMLKEKLTPNYDPTGTIKEEVWTTLTQVTRFPDPVGVNGKNEPGKCPCICCQMGCDRPLEPWGQRDDPSAKKKGSIATTSAASTTRSPPKERSQVALVHEEATPPQPRPSTTVERQSTITTQPSTTTARTSTSLPVANSFLEMTDAPKSRRWYSLRGSKDADSDKRKRLSLGFLTLPRFGRSRTHVDPPLESPSIPVPAPPIPLKVTRKAVPTLIEEPPRSKSFANLVRRRRDRVEASRSSIDFTATPTTPTWHPPIPSRTSFQLDTPRTPATIGGRFSLDSARPSLPSVWNGPAPALPPRRSSRVYMHRLTPPSNVTPGLREGSMGRREGSRIGLIVEEDEEGGRGSSDVARRQSRLMSSYGVEEERTGRRGVGAGERESEVGLAI